MLSSTSNSQNINSIEIIFDKIKSYDLDKLLSRYLSKIRPNDIEQTKFNLGIVYFVLFSVISITLFF